MIAEASVHTPVLYNEVLENLLSSPSLQASECAHEAATFLDCTVGGAGHLEGILQASEDFHVVGVDRDQRALDRAEERLAPYAGRFQLFHLPFSRVLDIQESGPFHGVLADFGVSSDQIHETERGISFREDAPLDMRMDESAERTADEVVNEYSIGDLVRVLGRGGVRHNAKKFAHAIVNRRPVRSVKDLADVIVNATPFRDRKETHPATVVFQAIRIEVNDEFNEIEILLDTVPQIVHPGARMVCISFHSLEDEIVTGRFRKWQGEGVPALVPGAHIGRAPSLGKLLTRKAVVPSEQEIQENPRARSARMRVFQFH